MIDLFQRSPNDFGNMLLFLIGRDDARRCSIDDVLRVRARRIPSLTDDRMKIRRVIRAADERAGGDMCEALVARAISP